MDAADCDSDLEDLRDSYASLQTLTAEMSQQRDPQRPHNQEWDFREGRQGLTRFLFLPPAWPLARLLLLLKFVVKQMEALLQNYCFETIATCKFPEQQNQYVYQMGRDLGQLMAIRLAEIVTELMQSVLQHPAKGLWMRVTPPWSKQSTPSYSMPPVASEPGQIKNRSGHRMAWSKFYACLLKGEYKSDMNGGMILYCASKLCLVPVAGWIQCLCGFRLHGCLLAKNVWWERAGGDQGAVALLPLLTPITHRSLNLGNSGSSIRGGIRKGRAGSWMQWLMWIGSHWTQGPSLISSFNYTVASFMMSSHRKLPWAGTLLQLVGWWSVSFFRAAWKWRIGFCWPDRKGRCGRCR